ncbi:M23 family metallopeptidase [Gracilimonas sp. BCB1]|uniref:M23 family metallopeptidase n=1 Tax=Gracilimonas sp. BCB1 TaxID=3152362 RepID=UPI0032D91D45
MKTVAILTLLLSLLSFDPAVVESANNGSVSFINPLNDKAVVLSNFGMRTHPILRTQKMHKGIDFKVSEGDKVYASEKGIVLFAGEKEKFGNFIMVKHSDGFVTRYAHLGRIDKELSNGSKVEKGQLLGLAGKSGQTTGPVLHFEILLDGEPQDPLKYLPHD